MPEVDLNFLETPDMLWWLGLVLALGTGVWTYFRLAAPLSPGLRQGLRVLRTLALLLLLGVLLEPMLTMSGESPGRPRLAVLVDRSSSMNLPGSQGGSRRDEAQAALAHLEERLSGRFDLEVRGFAGGVSARQPADSTYPWEPLGVTAMGDALEETLIQQAEAPAGAILLLTDGVHTAGKDPALVARNLSVPVYALVLGDTLPPADALIRQVRTQSIGFAGEPIAVRALIENSGLAGRAVTVMVRELPSGDAPPGTGSKLLATEHVTLPASGNDLEVALDIHPAGIGLTHFEVAVALDAPEASPAPAEDHVTLNNVRGFAVDVREKKTRVLYIEHEPDWDFSFLKRALDADTSLAYTYLVRQADGGLHRYGAAGPAGVPRGRADLSPFAAVILGRVDPAELPEETVAALRAYLLEGGGVLLLGAAEDSDLTHWQSAWGGLLPVAVRADRRRGYTQSVISVGVAGLTHDVTALGDSPVATEAGWSALPPAWIREGAYQTAPGARVLLSAQTAHPVREVPLMALAHSGAGRVAAVTARGFWRWDLTMRGISDELPAARDLWRRLMRFLAEPGQRERFHVRPARHVFQDSERPAFAAQLRDDTFQPLAGARVSLTITAASGEGGGAESLRLQLYPDGPAGRYGATAGALPPGAYRYQATAEQLTGSGRRTWTDEGQFWVEPMGPEYLDLAASRDLPRLLASASGGLAAGAQSADQLLDAVPGGYKRVRVVRQAEMWNHWAVFALLVTVLSVEWVLRRRKGLA